MKTTPTATPTANGGEQLIGHAHPSTADAAAKAATASEYKGDPMAVSPQMLARIAKHINGTSDELVTKWAAAFAAVYGN